ncbi:hypothetical protein Tco_1319017 [Tanacetum coccineum]
MEEDQAGPDPRLSHVALVGPDPKPMHDDFVATLYPQVHEILKHLDEEHIHEENPLSSTGTLSSMKKLDAFNFGDHFFNDKPTEEDLGIRNMETEVESMVTILIHQASSSVPPLSTPVTGLSPPKLVPSTTQAPVFIATIATTKTTLPLLPPPQQQSIIDSELAARVTTLENKFSDFEQKSKTLDNTTQNLGSRVFTLELRDLSYKINQTVNDVVKEAMFESGSYRTHPEHVALYEALEASMERANRDELLAKKDKSRKRCHNDQDPPPPLPDSDLRKKKRHDSDSSGSKQHPAPQSSAWKMSDTREAPSSSSKLDWLKPIIEEDRPASPELDWVIPRNDLSKTENNWANAIASSYQDPDEYKLLRQTGDMSSFINWFCKRIGKKKLSKANLEVPAFRYGYMKNHKKTIKNGQARTREQKSEQKPEAKARKSQIFSQLQRTPAPTEPSGHEESSSLYAELGLTDSEMEFDDDISPAINPEAQNEGQARSNPGKQVEGQDGSNHGDAADSQPQPSHVVHAGPNLEHTDLEATDASTQQNPEHLDEEFTTTAYPNVQEYLKLPTKDQVRLEEPASSTRTLSSLQNLDKELSFTIQFLAKKSHEDEPEKTNIEAEVQSMVTIPIHQDTSSVPLMTTLVIDLTVSQPVSTMVQVPLPTSTTIVTAITTTTSLLPPPPQPKQGFSDSILTQSISELEQHMADLVSKVVDEIITDAVDWAMQAPLKDRFRDLPEFDMKEILHHRMWESNSYKAHEDHM